MSKNFRPSAGYIGARRDGIIHARIHVEPPKAVCGGKLRIADSQRIPNFLSLNDVVRLFPKLNLREFAIKPAITDDAVFAWSFAGEIIRLRGAGDGGKRGHDLRERTVLAEFRDARRMFANERFGQANDIDDGEAIHFASA